MITIRQIPSLLLLLSIGLGATIVATGCTVKPGEYQMPSLGGDAADDKPLSEAVRNALESRPDINTARIDVSSDGDVVTLAGHVQSVVERESAGQVAQQVPGVRMVLNNVFAVSD